MLLLRRGADNVAALNHDPEKWTPVFRKDHAQTINQSAMAIRPENIAL
jgi:hypothetical protein